MHGGSGGWVGIAEAPDPWSIAGIAGRPRILSSVSQGMSNKFASLKHMTYTFGEDNANVFLQAGWTLIDTEATDHFTKFIFGWTGEDTPPYPEGVTNPLKQWLDLVDSEIERERVKLTKKADAGSCSPRHDTIS
jgi:hypothetical protein